MATRPHGDLHGHGPELLTGGQGRALLAILLIALGGVFFLDQAGVMSMSGNWWVMFIAIPGLVLLWAAYRGMQTEGRLGGISLLQGFLGIVALLLTLIFIFDPTWSFTRGWRLEDTFPFLRDAAWDALWRWGLLLIGAALLALAYVRRSLPTGIVGGAMAVVGLVFLLNISWNAVWPLAIVALGLGVLFWRR